jgi:4-amino-4-deoxy-L-arabinose transferase-like glycosyltransferase
VRTILSRVQAYPRSLLYVLALGLVVRTAFISFHQRPLISDEREYDRLAYNLASQAAYTYDGTPTAYRPIGYPAFVSASYFVLGHHPVAIKFLQALIDIGTSFLIYILLVGFPDRIRVLAAGLWAFNLPAILYVNLLMSETVFTFLLVLTTVLLTRYSDKRPRSVYLIGICLGVLVLIKPSALIFLLALPFFYRRLNLTVRALSLAALAFLLVLAPWFLRNYLAFGRLSLASNGGINLLIGNNPQATGAYGITFDPAILESARSEFEADQLAFQSASQYIIQNPGRFVLNATKKLGRLFESEGGLLVWTFHVSPEDTHTRYAEKYASIPFSLTLLTNCPYLSMMLLGVFGFLASKKDPFWWISSSLAGSWVLLHLIFFGGGRFHFPLMPFVAIYAAQFLSDAWSSLGSLTTYQKLTGIVIALLLVALWTYEGIFVYNV